MSRLSRDPRSFRSSILVCRDCEREFPIPRVLGQIREEGHVKHVWCPWCLEVTAHTEKRENE